MSRLMDKYNELKLESPDEIYCFKSGSFYIFFNEDAKIISNLLNLKITDFGKTAIKCGFPVNSKENKFEILEKNNIKYSIIELETVENKKEKKNTKVTNEVIEEIKNLNLMNISEKEAFIKICGWQAKLK